MLPRRLGLLVGLVVVLIVLLDARVAVAQEASSDFQSIYLTQSHTGSFWQANGDDAGTTAGELGFIWLEWTAYDNYDFVTIFHLLVNTTFVTYTPCEEGDSCTGHYRYPKHLGYAPMGNVGVVSESTGEVEYYPFNWYSLPRRGACPSAERLGEDGCGFYMVCAVKTISRGCLANKPGWKEALENGNEYYTLFNMVTKAFQFDSLEDGGCPDVTGDHLPVCENATTILREHPEVFGPIPVPQPSPRKSIAHHQVEEREEVPFHIDADPAPLVGVDYTTGSLCEIMSTGDCKTLLYLGDDFKHPVLLSYDEGIVFVHLHTPPATLACAPPRIIGYDYKSNSVVYNFTITENLSFIAADVNDGRIVGIMSEDTSDFKMKVVTIDLQSFKDSVITPYPIYNNSNSYKNLITFDNRADTLYFFGDNSYLSMPCIVSFELDNPNFTVGFPVINVNSSTGNPLSLLSTKDPQVSTSSNTFYAISGGGEGVIFGEMDPQLAALDGVDISHLDFGRFNYMYTTSTFDPASGTFLFCAQTYATKETVLVGIDIRTKTMIGKTPYDCKTQPFLYLH